MLKKIFHAIVAGLILAVLILLLPILKEAPLNIGQQVFSFNKAVSLASPAVVNVYNRSLQPIEKEERYRLLVRNLGSGVIMSQDGYILTNKHVIQYADQIVVALQNGNTYEANLVGSDGLTDLAVLKIKADNLPTIPQNQQRSVHVGDIALAIGNPYNIGQSVSQGIISGTGRNALGETIGRQNFIQTDASINRGNSGGALINSLGELIGINTLSIGKDSNEMAEGLNFAIPITLAKDIMQRIIKDGRVIRGYFGVQSQLFSQNDFDDHRNKGILITSLDPNGPAAKAGIQIGDLIIKFDQTDATSLLEMMRVIANTKPNTKVPVVISRLGKQLNFDVLIEEFPNEN